MKHIVNNKKPAQSTYASAAPRAVGIDRRTYRLPDKVTLVILACLVTAAVAWTHAPVLTAGTINIDDERFLFNNPNLQRPSLEAARTALCEVFESTTIEGYYEPLTLISLMLDVAAGGSRDHLRPFHMTSLILHLLNTSLIIVLIYMLFGRPWIAAGVGLIFGVHPLTVEPIAWVWERKTLLAGFFALCCMILYVRYTRRFGLFIYVGMMLSFTLALMAKPTVTPLPVLLLLLDWWPLKRLSMRAVLEKLPLLAVAAASSIVTIISTSRNASTVLLGYDSPIQLPIKVCYLIAFYLGKMVWARNLSSIYVLPSPMTLSQPWVLAAFISIIVLVGLLALSWRWTRAGIMAFLFFVIGMSPTLGVVQYSWVAASDKYAYIPAIGFLIALAMLLQRTAGGFARPLVHVRSYCVCFAVLAMTIWLAAETRAYLREWQTTEQYAHYMVAKAPDSPHAHNNRGIAYAQRGDHALAISDYSTAIKLKPDFDDAYYNRGNAYSTLSDFEQAITDYGTAIKLNAGYAEAFNNRGAAYSALGIFDAAIEDHSKAVALKADFAQAYNNRANALMGMQQFEPAIQDYSKAIELNPNYLDAFFNRGIAYRNLGQHARSVEDFTRAIELQPNEMEAYGNRAIAHFLFKQYDPAWTDIKKCQELGGMPSPEFMRDLIQESGRTE